MNINFEKVLKFAIPYVIVFGSYLFFHIIWDFNQNYGFIGAGLLAGFYMMMGLIFYFSLSKNHRFVAKGILWGAISIIIFLFSFGGCGVLR